MTALGAGAFLRAGLGENLGVPRIVNHFPHGGSKRETRYWPGPRYSTRTSVLVRSGSTEMSSSRLESVYLRCQRGDTVEEHDAGMQRRLR
jgi:hypothetical protein